jgi:peptidoglycan DL-endopeptidase CwlO
VRRLIGVVAVVALMLAAPQLGPRIGATFAYAKAGKLQFVITDLPGLVGPPGQHTPGRGKPRQSHAKPPQPSSAAPNAAAAVRYAMAQLGKPYRWGGNGPTTFDCSGLTYRAWLAAGLGWNDMTAADQYQWAQARGRLVPVHGLRAGDLLFYAFTRDPATIHHVTIYAGGGRMIEAPFSGATIRRVPVRDPELLAAARPGGGR